MHSSHSLCRLCAKSFEVSSLLHIFHDSYPSTGPLDVLIKRYLPFSVSVSDSLTHYVCKLCCAHVFRWHKFFTLCIKTQAQLKCLQHKSLGRSTQGKSVDNEVKKVSDSLCGVENNSSVTKKNPESSRAKEQSVSDNTAKRKKSNYCIARWCNNSNDKDIPLYRVPKDRNRALQWLSAADRMDLVNKDVAYLYRCYLCAAHFSKEMFVNENSKSLNRNAVPSIFSKPAYAIKVEEALSSSELYPRELHGVRLKNILPKSVQKSEEISAPESLSVPSTQESYAQIIRVVCDSHDKLEKPLQEALFVTDPVASHCNIDINTSMSSVKGHTSERLKIVEVVDPNGIDIVQSQVLNEDAHVKRNRYCETPPSSNLSEVFKSSVKKFHTRTEQLRDIPRMCDNINPATNHRNAKQAGTVNQFHCKVNVENEQSCSKIVTVGASPNTLMDFSSHDSNVTMLDLTPKPTNIAGEDLVVLEINIGEDQHIGNDSLALHGIPPEDSLSSNIPLASSFSLDPSFLNHGLNFPSKDVPGKDCLENMVVSQDVLLMHSSNDHIEQARDHGLRQDKNLNNLCGSAVREPVPGTPIAYEERSMIAEASVRTIECTSPNHGQIIEGLIDLDQFLDNGYVANQEKPL